MRDWKYVVAAAAAVFWVSGVLTACVSPMQSSGASAGSVSVVLPCPASGASASSASARTLLGSGLWVSLTVSDGTTTQTKRQSGVSTGSSSGSVNFDFNLSIGTTYTMTASAGTTVGDVDTTEFTGTTTVKVAAGATVPLYLRPTTITDTISASGNFTLSAAGLTHKTYNVQLGTDSRLCLAGLPANCVVYCQNADDGTPITAAAQGCGYLVVEKASISSGSSNFLMTIYATAAVSEIVYTSLDTASHYMPVYSLSSMSSTACMTHYGSKLCIADHTSGNIAIFDTSTNTFNSYSCGMVYPWGIATDGTNIYFAQNTSSGNVCRDLITNLTSSAPNPTTIGMSAGNHVSGCAYIGGYVYYCSTQSPYGKVFRVSALGESAAEGTLIATAANPGDMAGACVHGTDLYFSAIGDNTIYKVDTTAGTPTAIPFANAGCNYITTDDSYLYFTAGTAVKRIALSSTDPAASETLFDFATISLENPSGMETIDGALYVIGSNGMLYRLY